MAANDFQHGGTHYKGMAIQPWDYIVANGLGYLEGNVVKYITRWREKGGIEDLKKAQHYLQKLLEVESAKQTAADGIVAVLAQNTEGEKKYVGVSPLDEHADIHNCGRIKADDVH